MTDIDDGALNSLAEKIDSLDLTEDEKALVDSIFERAASFEPEVEGFGYPTVTYSYTGLESGAQLSSTAFKLGSALKLVGSPSLTFEGGPPPP